MTDRSMDRTHFNLASRFSVLAITAFGLFGCLNSDSDGGDGSSGNEPMTLSGIASTGPIDSGDITLNIGEESYTGTTSSTGEFSIEIPKSDAADFPGDAYVKIRAAGTSDSNQEHLELLSHVGDWSQLERLAGDSREVTENDLSSLYVDSIQTALVTEAQAVNGDTPVTSPTGFLSALQEANTLHIAARISAVEMLANSEPEQLDEEYDTTLDFMSARGGHIRSWVYAPARTDLAQTTKEQIADLQANHSLSIPDGYSHSRRLNVHIPDPGPIQISQEPPFEEGVYRDSGIDRASITVEDGIARLDFSGDLTTEHSHWHKDEEGQDQLAKCLATYDEARVIPIVQTGEFELIGIYSRRHWEHNSTGISGVDAGNETVHEFHVERVTPGNHRTQLSRARWGDSMWMLDWRSAPEDGDQYSVRSPLILQLRPEDQLARVEYGNWHTGESVSLDIQGDTAVLSAGTDQLRIRPVTSNRQEHFEADVITDAGEATSRSQWAEKVSVFAVDPEAYAWGSGALIPGFFVHDMLDEPPAVHPSDWYGLELLSGGEGHVIAYNYVDDEWYRTEWPYGWSVENNNLVLRRCTTADNERIPLTEDPTSRDCSRGYRRSTYTLDNKLTDGHIYTRNHIQVWTSATSFRAGDNPATDTEASTVLRRFDEAAELPIE